MPTTAGFEADVVVVGAGLSGLNAARLLTAAGVNTLVVEARDRVGGRTLSRAIGGATFDLGAQWMGPTQDRLLDLIADLEISTFPTWSTGRSVLDLPGHLSSYTGDIPAVPAVDLLSLHATLQRTERARRRVPLDTPWESAGAPGSAENWKQHPTATRRVRELFDAAVRTVFGSEPAELGLLYFLFYLNSGGGLRRLIQITGGAQQDRFVGGAQQIAQRLAEPLGERLLLSAPVHTITQAAERVTVRTATADISARYAIVAIPPLLAGRITWEPALPPLRRQLTQRMPMGYTTKALAFYDTAFWRYDGWSGEAVSTTGPATYVVDNTSGDGGQACLLAFLVGKPGRTWAARDPAARRQAVLDQLSRYFGPQAQHPTAYVEHDWSTEPWTGGCPVGIMPPGVMSQFGPALSEPCGLVHWAGTETAGDWCGFMEGALEAGERAADDILALL